MKRALVVLLLVHAACLEGPPHPDTSSLDVGYYECQVQPLFDRSCAFTSCHGDPGRALFVFSMSKTRIVETELIGEKLTDKELCANFYRAAAFATPDPAESQLITKPETLDGEGSQFHAGNYLFTPGAPEAECLVQWMRGEVQEVATSTPAAPCTLPWRTRASCTPRKVTCAEAIEGPDLPEVAQ